MSLRQFIHTYFPDWKITSISTNKISGNIRLRNKETFILVNFNMNNGTSWSDERVTVSHVEACA